MPNRLANASSPYLLQHQDNPVDWYEWGEEAFGKARDQDRPILLSVGYSACHWCHVMAHESFEDEPTAAYMNEHFVSVKVDREERPDVDRIYMEAVQAMSGHGGWPMTVFITPDGKPFFAGTYFPRDERPGIATFRTVMESVSDAWATNREELESQAERLTDAVRSDLPATDTTPGAPFLRNAIGNLASTFDHANGGFGGAPKFPQVPNLELLLRSAALGTDRLDEIEVMIEVALDKMARGGIYDHLGGGFARYAVDNEWLVPHFEKMLYDNAQLARAYLRGWQLTGREDFRAVVEETLHYLQRDMTDPAGGLYSAEDADSEGVEGKFYVWSWDEMQTLLGDDAQVIATLYGASPRGNFEGANILHLPEPPADVAQRLGIDGALLEAKRRSAGATMLEARGKRIRPGLDDKVVTAWNGLALRAFAEAAAVLQDERYLDAARNIATFVEKHLTREDGRLLRSWRQGQATVLGFCDDYAAMAVGLFTVYQATGEDRWYVSAERLTRQMIDLFHDEDGGGFFATGHDAEALITRPKNFMDNPTPSDNSLAAEALLLLAAYTGDAGLRSMLDGVFRSAGRLIARYPNAVGHLLSVLAVAVDGPKELAIVGSSAAAREPLVAVAWEAFRPDCVLAIGGANDTTIPLLADRDGGTSGAQAFVCRNFTCDLPAQTADELRAQLSG